MDSKTQSKSKRRKKKAPRTEVVLSDSESDTETQQTQTIPTEARSEKAPSVKRVKAVETTTKPLKESPDTGVESAFAAYYLQTLVKEFEDDLESIRKADDFTDSALPMLVGALQAGTSVFSIEDQRRVVAAGGKA